MSESHLIQIDPVEARERFAALAEIEDRYQQLRASAWTRQAELNELAFLLDIDYRAKADWE